MRTYRVKVKAVFEGHFDIKAENREQAAEYAEKHCGIVGPHIHSTLDDEDVDWEFDVHPDKKIVSVKKL
jgi:hypothetical protein